MYLFVKLLCKETCTAYRTCIFLSSAILNLCIRSRFVLQSFCGIF